MRFIIILLVISLFLLGCSSDLPPGPNAPGLSGMFDVSIFSWATEPVTFSADETRISCSANEDIVLAFSIEDRYIFNTFYIWKESESRWIPFEFRGTASEGDWFLDSAEYFLELSCSDAQLFADSNDDIFVAAYSCSRTLSGWNCYDNKWQLEIVKLLPTRPEIPGSISGPPSISSGSQSPQSSQNQPSQSQDSFISWSSVSSNIFTHPVWSIQGAEFFIAGDEVTLATWCFFAGQELSRNYVAGVGSLQSPVEEVSQLLITEDGLSETEGSRIASVECIESDASDSIIAWDLSQDYSQGRFYQPFWDIGDLYYVAGDEFTASVWCFFAGDALGIQYEEGVASVISGETVEQIAIGEQDFIVVEGLLVEYFQCS